MARGVVFQVFTWKTGVHDKPRVRSHGLLKPTTSQVVPFTVTHVLGTTSCLV